MTLGIVELPSAHTVWGQGDLSSPSLPCQGNGNKCVGDAQRQLRLMRREHRGGRI